MAQWTEPGLANDGYAPTAARNLPHGDVPWALHHDLGVSPAMVVTVRIFLSMAKGGEARFPFFGSNDKHARNATEAVLIQGRAQQWLIPERIEIIPTSHGGLEPVTQPPIVLDEFGAEVRARLLRSKRYDDDLLGVCAQLPNTTGSSKPMYRRKSATVVPPKRRGVAIVYWSRLKGGEPDPDGWHHDCPVVGDSTLWVAVKHKVLPIELAEGEPAVWDHSVAKACPEHVCRPEKKKQRIWW